MSLLTVVLGVGAFTVVTLALVAVLSAARVVFVPTGNVQVIVNGGSDRDFTTAAGQTLLEAFTARQILIPSGCGGQGTCGACRVRVAGGGGPVLATETVHLTRVETREGWRLACQVKVKEDLSVVLPEGTFGRGTWTCTVRSAKNVATFIREIILDLPAGATVPFRAGGYIQVECPPHHVKFRDFDIESKYRADWDKYDLWRFESRTREPVTRAYSLANYPLEKGVLMLNVRIATPPLNELDVPPGKASSYLFGLASGDAITVTGPYGEFYAKETDREMVFIGGGAGMAPMRAHILDQLERLNTMRRITYWYGARSLREAFYVEDFDRLAAERQNFDWYLALSEPLAEDDWSGLTGFIHQVVYDNYLKDHPAPEELEYYLCGPPMMIHATRTMLDSLGVESENISFDDFG